MKTLKHFGLFAIAAGLFLATGHNAAAQVAVSIGEPPVCPYGYYEVPPYNCAPDGYYGPEWFSGGIFIGAWPGTLLRTRRSPFGLSQGLPRIFPRAR